MSKSILSWLIIVTFFVNQFAFAWWPFSRSTTPPIPVDTPVVTVTVDQTPALGYTRISGACGKVRSFLAGVGRFCHNHSDLISKTVILTLDVMYVVGSFSEYGAIADVSIMLLNYAGLIGVPFATRETAKAIGDARYALNRKCPEVLVFSVLKGSNSFYSGTATIAYSIGGSLLNLKSTHDAGMAIFNALKVPGFVFLVLNLVLDIYQFKNSKRIIKEFEDHPVLAREGISLLVDPSCIPENQEAATLSARIRIRMDVVSLKDFQDKARRLLVCERTPLLGDIESQATRELPFTFIIDSIKLQSRYAIGDLILNLFGDAGIGASRILGPGKYQACIDLGSALAWDSILMYKKCKQARLRKMPVQAVTNNAIVPYDPEIGTLQRQGIEREQATDIDTVTIGLLVINTSSSRELNEPPEFPIPDIVIDIVPEPVTDRYAIMLAENPDIPIEVRIAGAHSCNPMESRDLVYNSAIPLEVRIAAAHHCTPEDSYGIAVNESLDIRIRVRAAQHCTAEAGDLLVHNEGIPIEIRRAAAGISEFRNILESVHTEEGMVEELSIVPYDYDREEERLYPVLTSPSLDDDRFVSLSRAELFAIALDPDEPLDVRIGAACLLK